MEATIFCLLVITASAGVSVVARGQCICFKDTTDCSSGHLTALALTDVCSGTNYLDLHDNQFPAVPTSIKNLHLTHLDISRNSLQTLSGKFLTSATVINASWNSISFVSDLPSKLRELTLSHNNLHSMPQGNHNLLLLDISHNRVAEGVEEFLSSNRNIQQLNVSYNELTYLEGCARAVTLRTLDASHNQITYLVPGSFQGLTQLVAVNLSHNGIEMIAPYTFNNMSIMEKLDLSYNKLKTLYATPMYKMISLNRDNLKYSQLKKLYEEVGKFSKFGAKYLDQEDENMSNNVEATSTDIFTNLTKLIYLDLSGNALNSISGTAFRQLPELQFLDMSHNKLQDIDSDVFAEIKNLSVLKLSHNELSMTWFRTMDFSLLSELKVIDLSHCKLEITYEVLPSTDFYFSVLQGKDSDMQYVDLSRGQLKFMANGAFVGVPRAQVLNLSHNAIKEIRKGVLDGLPQLKVLDLSHNALIHFRRGAFVSVPHLHHLDLSWNNISYLPEGLFSTLKRLVSLDLSHNRLTFLGANQFGQLNNLVELDLSHNWLLNVDAGAFAGLADLQTLNLSKNYLSTLPRNVFLSLKRLEVLNVGNNLMRHVIDDKFSGSSRLHQLDTSINGYIDKELPQHGFEASVLLPSVTRSEGRSLNAEIQNQQSGFVPKDNRDGVDAMLRDLIHLDFENGVSENREDNEDNGVSKGSVGEGRSEESFESDNLLEDEEGDINSDSSFQKLSPSWEYSRMFKLIMDAQPSAQVFPESSETSLSSQTSLESGFQVSSPNTSSEATSSIPTSSNVSQEDKMPPSDRLAAAYEAAVALAAAEEEMDAEMTGAEKELAEAKAAAAAIAQRRREYSVVFLALFWPVGAWPFIFSGTLLLALLVRLVRAENELHLETNYEVFSRCDTPTDPQAGLP